MRGVPCTFTAFFTDLTRNELGLDLHVCGAAESLQLCEDDLVGVYSDLAHHLVVAHDWSRVYYGKTVLDMADEVDVTPIREVLDLFDAPSMLAGTAPRCN